MKFLSKSVIFLFLYDFVVLSCATVFWYSYFKMPEGFLWLTYILSIDSISFIEYEVFHECDKV